MKISARAGVVVVVAMMAVLHGQAFGLEGDALKMRVVDEARMDI